MKFFLLFSTFILLEKAVHSFLSQKKFQEILQMIEKPKADCKCVHHSYGVCKDDGTCLCDEDFSGEDCTTHCPKNCNGQGICTDGIGCLCNKEFTGNFLIFTKEAIAQNINALLTVVDMDIAILENVFAGSDTRVNSAINRFALMIVQEEEFAMTLNANVMKDIQEQNASR